MRALPSGGLLLSQLALFLVLHGLLLALLLLVLGFLLGLLVLLLGFQFALQRLLLVVTLLLLLFFLLGGLGKGVVVIGVVRDRLVVGGIG